MRSRFTVILPPVYTVYALMVVLLLVQAPAIAQSGPLNVTVSRFTELAYFPESSAPASVVSLNDAVLSAQIQTSVKKIPVKVADRVKQGDVLVELDCRNAKSTATANAASLNLAQYQYQRAKKLRKKDHISEEVLRRRTSELASARAALNISRVDVERCTITAPFNGVVQERLIDVGEWVSPGTTLIHLVDLENIEVTAEISAFNSQGIAQAGDYGFMLGNRRYPLTRRAISAVTDASGRSRTIRLTFSGGPNSKEQNRAAPGESGRLIWREPKRYLPSDYLEKRDGQYGVLVVEGNKARFVLTPLAQEGRPILIELGDDAKVIVKGRQSVKDNDSVKVIK